MLAVVGTVSPRLILTPVRRGGLALPPLLYSVGGFGCGPTLFAMSGRPPRAPLGSALSRYHVAYLVFDMTPSWMVSGATSLRFGSLVWPRSACRSPGGFVACSAYEMGTRRHAALSSGNV